MASWRKYYGVPIILLIVVMLSLCIAESNVSDDREKLQTKNNQTASTKREDCVQAEPPVDSALTRTICHPYPHARLPYGQRVCKSTLEDELLYATPAEQKWRESLFVTFRFKGGTLPRMPKSPMTTLTRFCWRLIMHMYCRFMLPRCDLTSSRPQPQPICKEACREFKRRCQKEWTQIQKKHKSVSWRVQQFVIGSEDSFSLMWCKHLPRRKGPDIPECYYPNMLNEDAEKPPVTETCFYGDGQSYRGNVSVTRSGYTCQSWNSQCPHRHHRTPNDFPELKNAGNACRNPGAQAPYGPWCYTTNPTVRWEYCRVEKCDQNGNTTEEKT